jgi:hypothetical protein
MKKTLLSTLTSLQEEINLPDPNQDKLALYARALRWQTEGSQDMAEIMGLVDQVRGKKEPGFWEVERAILEIASEQAGKEQVSFLVKAFRTTGKHGDDRRRMAMKGLGRVAALTGDVDALEALQEALRHTKKDTRGWAIGYVLDCYRNLSLPLPKPVIERLQYMIEHDKSPDVRVEAVMALASHDIVDETVIRDVLHAAETMSAAAEKH